MQTLSFPINLHGLLLETLLSELRCRVVKAQLNHCSLSSLLFPFNSGYALVNHAIATYSVTCPLDCTLECLRDTRCQSFNCADAGHTCEINGQSKATSLNDFQSMEGSTYYGPTTETVRHLVLRSKFKFSPLMDILSANGKSLVYLERAFERTAKNLKFMAGK